MERFIFGTTFRGLLKGCSRAALSQASQNFWPGFALAQLAPTSESRKVSPFLQGRKLPSMELLQELNKLRSGCIFWKDDAKFVTIANRTIAN
jgi:hypothetical protein